MIDQRSKHKSTVSLKPFIVYQYVAGTMVGKAGHAVRWASHGGPATRTKRRPEPHAQPVASVRSRSGRSPLLTPRGCTTPVPRSDGSQLCGRIWEEKRHHRALVPRDAMFTGRSAFRLLAMASPDWMITATYCLKNTLDNF